MAAQAYTYIGFIRHISSMDGDKRDAILRKWCDFRVGAVQQTRGAAFGATPINVERRRTWESYYEELSDERYTLCVLVETTSRFQGNVFSSVDELSSYPASSDAIMNEADHRILVDGDIVGSCSSRGPLSLQEYTVFTAHGQLLPDEIESRFHTGNLYLKPCHRKRANVHGVPFYSILLSRRQEFLQSFVLSRHTLRPAYYRSRGTIAPEKYKNSPNYVKQVTAGQGRVVGFVTEAESLRANRTRLEQWPPGTDRKFYSDKSFMVVETLLQLDESRTTVLDPCENRVDMETLPNKRVLRSTL